MLISSGGMKLRLGRLEPRGGCGALVGPASRLALTSTAEGQGPGGRERLGGNFAASPVVADGRIIFANQQGKTTVVQPGRTFAPIATNTLDIGCMASPAVDGKSLYLRTKTHLYRIEAAGK